jgi:hypothetical protein
MKSHEDYEGHEAWHSFVIIGILVALVFEVWPYTRPALYSAISLPHARSASSIL